MTSIETRYPATRLRRTRRAEWSRRLVRESRLSADDLVWPIFVTEADLPEPVPAMPAVVRYPIDEAVEAAREAAGLGIPLIAVFPHTAPDKRDARGGEALNADNLVCRTVRAIKEAAPAIGVMTDVALDPYTSHGQDGVIDDSGRVLNDATVEILVQQAKLQAEAGCDVLAPSDMMDGRIGAIRAALEAEGHTEVQLMAYAAKYASAFYGPFRDAVGSRGALAGDKKSYQMDPANSVEAVREAGMDIAEGADSLIVKPGLAYLDVLARVKAEFGMPSFAYQVSGEYAMLHAGADQGAFDLDSAMLESLAAFKRAGADGAITYFALRAAKLLTGQS